MPQRDKDARLRARSLVTAASRDADQLGARYPSGPGQYVAIYSNVDHVFVTINGRDWGASRANFDHGPGFGAQSTAGFAPSHPPGL